MNFLLLLLQIPLLVYLIKKGRKQHSDPLLVNSYYYLLSFKVTAGLMVGLFYYNYYKTGDTIYYAETLQLLSELFYSSTYEYVCFLLGIEFPTSVQLLISGFESERTLVFIRLLSPLYIATGSNYWMLSVYLSLFSFLGFWKLSHTLLRLFDLKPLAVLLSFFVFPSVVFWSSGVLKESLVMGAIGYLLSIVLSILYRIEKVTFYKIFVFLLFPWILLQVKFYYFAVLFAVLLPYCVVKIISQYSPAIGNHKLYRIGVWLLMILACSYLVSFIHPMLSPDRVADLLHFSYKLTLERSGGENVFYFPELSSDWGSFLPHIPQALSYGLFGPYLWHCTKLISLFSGIENTVILILFITFILGNFKKESIARMDLEGWSVVLYTVVLAVLITIGTPNWGTLVRYKVGYLPFFLLFILNRNPFTDLLEEKFNLGKKSTKK